MRNAVVATIGVYGCTLPAFLDALHDANVRMVIDVRQRRGVRGSQYSRANARRLQVALAEAQIAYRPRKELAPTTELRQLQYAADDRLGVGKRARELRSTLSTASATSRRSSTTPTKTPSLRSLPTTGPAPFCASSSIPRRAIAR